MKDYQINSNYNYSWETIKSMLQKLDGIIPDLQPKLTAGDNIAISEQNVISATDTKYTAGDNIAISEQNVISATDTKYTAGTGISIDANNEISCAVESKNIYLHEITISNGNPSPLFNISFILKAILTTNTRVMDYASVRSLYRDGKILDYGRTHKDNQDCVTASVDLLTNAYTVKYIFDNNGLSYTTLTETDLPIADMVVNDLTTKL